MIESKRPTGGPSLRGVDTLKSTGPIIQLDLCTCHLYLPRLMCLLEDGLGQRKTLFVKRCKPNLFKAAPIKSVPDDLFPY